jgi:hypothetical protein
MNTLLLAAGLLSILVGLIHSILGELLIFKKLREDSFIPTLAMQPLHEKSVRILWATWHLASIFGWGIGAILISLSKSNFATSDVIIQYIAFSMFFSGVLVLVATRAKHPGWIGLCTVAVLCWLA